jgi:16S rRNA (guanine527-N7)-methyltransferase
MRACPSYAKIGGKFAALKGENADEELKGASKGAKKLSARIIGDEKSQLVYKTANGATSNTRRIIVFEKLSPTPSAYPRAYAKIKRSPLF